MPSLTSFASFVLLGLAFIGTVQAQQCSTTQLLLVTSDNNTATCQSETGLSITALAALTPADILAICNSPGCMALMNDVAGMGLGDCTLPGTNVTVQTDILDTITATCSGTNSTTASTSSSGSGATVDAGFTASPSTTTSSGSGTTPTPVGAGSASGNAAGTSSNANANSNANGGGTTTTSTSDAATVVASCASTIVLALTTVLL